MKFKNNRVLSIQMYNDIANEMWMVHKKTFKENNLKNAN